MAKQLTKNDVNIHIEVNNGFLSVLVVREGEEKTNNWGLSNVHKLLDGNMNIETAISEALADLNRFIGK